MFVPYNRLCATCLLNGPQAARRLKEVITSKGFQSSGRRIEIWEDIGMTVRLDGKVEMVNGGASGIGAETSSVFVLSLIHI